MSPASDVYREHLPSRGLARTIDRVWTRDRSHDARETRVLPDGCVDVLFVLDEARPRALLVGAMTSAHLAGHVTRDLVAVRFRPGGAMRLVGDVAAFTDELVPLHDAGLDAARTLDALLAAPDRAAQVVIAERFVVDAIARPLDRLVMQGISRLVSAAPPSVDALAAELGITRQHLARRVRAAVGVGPKELARIARMQRTVRAIESGRRDFATLAFEHGYCDQAHLGNELRALVGLTPGELARAPGSVSPITSPFEGASPTS